MGTEHLQKQIERINRAQKIENIVSTIIVAAGLIVAGLML